MKSISVSRMRTTLLCPRKAYWRYEKGFVDPLTTPQLLGLAFHRGIQHRDHRPAVDLIQQQEVHSQEEQDEQTIQVHTIRAMITGALEHWRMDWVQEYCELPFSVPLYNPDTGHPSRTYYLTGRVDEVVQDGSGYWWLNEYKTSSQKPNKDLSYTLPVDTQLSLYFYVIQKELGVNIRGINYRLAKKPGIRQKQNETKAEFGTRVLEEYQEKPEKYFFEIQVPRDPKDIERLQRNMWEFSKMYHFLRTNDMWPMDTNACSHWGRTCSYMPLCREEEDAEYLYQVEER